MYACMELSSDWEVQERANTNLKTNFYVGQQVFTMRDNKIAEMKISRITSREYGEMKVPDISSLISMEIKKKSFEDIVEEM